jgi:arylsulfatase A-like enzyme
MPGLSRRDFLKLGSALSGAFAISGLMPRTRFLETTPATSLPNILILVLDALSAENMSLHGYPRATTPNLERFAQRATVYNRHYAAGNFTTPGTASLLTGVYPWTHHAINGSGLIARNLEDQNLFRAVGKQYFRLAFSQNVWPNYFFGQFQHDIERVLSPASFSLLDQVVAGKFGADLVDSHRAFDDFLLQDWNPPGSLMLGLAENIQLYEAISRAPAPDYPKGLPRTENYPVFYRLKDVFDGLIKTVQGLSRPSLAFLHIWAPHHPYVPTKDFDGFFLDGWAPTPKRSHKLVEPVLHHSRENVEHARQLYDEYVANLDAELGRWLDFLEAEGHLDHSYVVVTSDHGEMFERGMIGHWTPLLYDPIVRVPLLISAPGQKRRRDVNVPTNSVDLLPTLVHLSGGATPEWCEGQVLPALGGVEDPERSIFMMDAKENLAFSPLTRASFAIRKGQYKLIFYRGFPQYGYEDKFELYDVENDPAELNDLSPKTSPIARVLREELLTRIEKANSIWKTAK